MEMKDKRGFFVYIWECFCVEVYLAEVNSRHFGYEEDTSWMSGHCGNK